MRKNLFILLTGILALVGGVCFLISGANGEKSKPTVTEQICQTSQVQKPRVLTKSDMEYFIMTEINGILRSQLVMGELPYVEINERFKSSNKLVVGRTGKNVNVTLVANYHWAHKGVEAAEGCSSDGTVACLELYIPAIMNTFERLRDSGNPEWRKVFQSHVIVIFMHEMEHARIASPSDHIDISEESRAWDDTCRYVIDPMVEIYGLPLFKTEDGLYRAWKIANGNTKDPVWVNAVQNIYGKIDGLTTKK
jgi:hypothetical protein